MKSGDLGITDIFALKDHKFVFRKELTNSQYMIEYQREGVEERLC